MVASEVYACISPGANGAPPLNSLNVPLVRTANARLVAWT